MASLVESVKAISAEGCQVAIITHGTEEGARRWKEDTGCPFPMYFDWSRGLYRLFGMRRSLSQTFTQDTMAYVMEKTLVPNFDPATFNSNPYPDIPDDRIQMGGDVVFNKEGNVEFSYCNKSPVDRTEIPQVLQTLRDLN